MDDIIGLWKGVLAEFLAVALFVYVCCGTAMTSQVDHVATSLVFGFAILVLAHMFGHVSGGHINPAVTIGLAVCQRVNPIRAVAYIFAQILGGIVGAALLAATLSSNLEGCLGANGIASASTIGEAFLLEFVTTFILVFTVYATIDPSTTDTNSLGVLPIGMAVMICHLLSIPITGCGINPARSFGPAFIAYVADLDGCSDVFDDHWVFWIAPIGGGITAALLYGYVIQDSDAHNNLREVFKSKKDLANKVQVEEPHKDKVENTPIEITQIG